MNQRIYSYMHYKQLLDKLIRNSKCINNVYIFGYYTLPDHAQYRLMLTLHIHTTEP